MVICLERGAGLHTAQLMPLPLTVSCFSKIKIGFTFLVPAHPGSPGQRAVKRVCVCMCSVTNGSISNHLFTCNASMPCVFWRLIYVYLFCVFLWCDLWKSICCSNHDKLWVLIPSCMKFFALFLLEGYLCCVYYIFSIFVSGRRMYNMLVTRHPAFQMSMTALRVAFNVESFTVLCECLV